MNGVINVCVTGINDVGRGFCAFAGGLFIQSTVLIAILLIADWLLRKRVKATFRYWLWMLVFVKLILPPTLSLPTSVGYWYRAWPGASRPVSSTPVSTRGDEPVVQKSIESVGWASAHAESSSANASISPESVAVSPVESHRVALTWQGAVFLFWLIGVGVLGVILIQRVFFVRRLAKQSRPAGESLTELLGQCREQMDVRRSVGVRLSPATFSPAVCGLLRPVILLPEALLEKLSRDDLRSVLIHELAHIKRGDLWLNSAQTLLQIAYFYNPFVWLAGVMTRRVREQAVDEMVLVALGAEAKNYSRTLVDIAEMAFFKPTWTLRLIGVAESKKSLEGRIKHMLTMPVPKNAKVGLWGFLIIAVVAAVLLPMAQAQKNASAESSGDYSILLLDDKDPTYKGNGVHDDRLYLMDSKGNIEGAVTGFNVEAGVGGLHVLAVDDQRKALWVAENAGERLWHFDLATGRLLGQTPNVKAIATAVDPATGNAWVVTHEIPAKKNGVVVVSPSGKIIAEYPAHGLDIACSLRDDSFWIVGESVTKLDKKGTVLGQIAGLTSNWACSVSMDQNTGNAWIVMRESRKVIEGKPEVWIVDKNLQIQKRIDLGDLIPFCVAIDSENGVAWVGCLGVTLHFTMGGEKLPSARYASGYSVAAGGSRDQVLAADEDGLMMAKVSETGKVDLGMLQNSLDRNRRWVAKVPFAGAKLETSPSLASLTEYKERDLKLAEHPESAEKLKSLGQAVLMHANDYDDKLPDTLDDVGLRLGSADMEWLKANVAYLGKGLTTSAVPATPVAYDKTVLREGNGTLVLYLDGHVAFQSPGQLETLGVSSTGEPSLVARTQSAKRLAHLGTNLLIYANEHDDRFPDTLQDLDEDVRAHSEFPWMLNSVTYLGKYVGTRDAPDHVLAYDKTLLEAGYGTNVLYLDSHVTFETPVRLEKLGIKRPEGAESEVAMQNLRWLALAAIMYADENKGVFPNDLGELENRIQNPTVFAWLVSNAEYLGKGMKEESLKTTAATTPLAYWRTAPASYGRTVIVFFDGHAEVTDTSRLEKLGIKVKP